MLNLPDEASPSTSLSFPVLQEDCPVMLKSASRIDTHEAKKLGSGLLSLLKADKKESTVNPYQSITLCLIDAVFSINARYEGVKRVVKNYCVAYGLDERRASQTKLPKISEQDTFEKLIARISGEGAEVFANTIFKNRWRTSPTNGILKAEAVYLLAKILKRHGVNCLQDVPVILRDETIETEFRTVPGQRSGISFKYFLMETGVEELVKPDRMLLAWLERTLNRRVSAEEAQALLTDAAAQLRPRFPNVTPRQLDLLIWSHEREHEVRNSRAKPIMTCS